MLNEELFAQYEQELKEKEEKEDPTAKNFVQEYNSWIQNNEGTAINTQLNQTYDNNTEIEHRSDAFIVDWNGTVSANDYKTSADDSVSVSKIITLFKSLSSWAINQGWTPPNN